MPASKTGSELVEPKIRKLRKCIMLLFEASFLGKLIIRNIMIIVKIIIIQIIIIIMIMIIIILYNSNNSH